MIDEIGGGVIDGVLDGLALGVIGDIDGVVIDRPVDCELDDPEDLDNDDDDDCELADDDDEVFDSVLNIAHVSDSVVIHIGVARGVIGDIGGGVIDGAFVD